MGEPPFSAITQRTPLELLTLPSAFSKVEPLTPKEFAEKANLRRPRIALQGNPPLNAQILEELHRHGILVPFYRVDLRAGDPDRVVDVPQSSTGSAPSTELSQLLAAAREGRAVDPASEEFAPWPKERLRSPWPSVESGYLYSRHQFLALESIYPLLSKLRHEAVGNTAVWRWEPARISVADVKRSLGPWRSLAVTLSALDSYYWPLVIDKIRPNDFAEWLRMRAELDSSGMLDWLGFTRAQLADQAASLKVTASMRDVLGDFYDLVRRADADSWETLRGDALAAMDARLAADVLDRFGQDVDGTGRAAPGPGVPLSQLGLSEQEESLDAALTDLHLSPYPSLVVAVEGQTEELILPRAMEVLGIQAARSRIEVVNFEGSKDLMLVARHATRPVLGKSYGEWVHLDRPVTRFLVLTDPENKFETPAARQSMRKKLLDSITFGIPAEYSKDLRGYRLRSRVVEIRTWGRKPFEFAHFTDRELADALMRLAQVPFPGGRQALIARVALERSKGSPDINRVQWPGRGKILKPELAEDLWPVLERKIRRAADKGHPGPPIMRAALRAYEMATGLPRRRMVLVRRR